MVQISHHDASATKTDKRPDIEQGNNIESVGGSAQSPQRDRGCRSARSKNGLVLFFTLLTVFLITIGLLLGVGLHHDQSTTSSQTVLEVDNDDLLIGMCVCIHIYLHLYN